MNCTKMFRFGKVKLHVENVTEKSCARLNAIMRVKKLVTYKKLICIKTFKLLTKNNGVRFQLWTYLHRNRRLRAL